MAGLRVSRGAFTELAHRVEAGIFNEGVLQIRKLSQLSLRKKRPPALVTAVWAFGAGDPVNRVERMRAEIGHLSAGVIPEPAEVVESAIRIVGALGAGRATFS